LGILKSKFKPGEMGIQINTSGNGNPNSYLEKWESRLILEDMGIWVAQ